MTLNALLARLDGVKPTGHGYMARCPAHPDDTQSLAVSVSDDAKILTHCFAGCSTAAVLDALGLTMKDLFPETDTPSTRQIVATYPYHDPAGAHLFDVVRYRPKDFRQRRADGAWSMAGVRRVLYHLPKIQGRTTVFWVEGEKDADRLWAVDVPATTSAGGVDGWAKWEARYVAQLRAAAVERVVVLPDNDDPGRRYATRVAAACHAAGLTVIVVPLPGLAPKGDISDWLDAGHTTAELRALVAATPRSTPTADAPAPDGATTEPDDITAGVREWSAPDLLAKVATAPPVPMVIEGLIPGEGTTLFHAQPRALKTWLALECGVALTTGTPALGLLAVPQALPVLYVTNEDSWHMVGRRFRAILQGRGRADPPAAAFGFAIHTGVWLDDLAWQAWLIRRIRDVGYRVLILDPLRSLTACVDQGPRELQPFALVLRRLMGETGIVPLLSHHDVKPLPGGQADARQRPQRASGGGLFSIADAPIHCERLGDEDPATSLVVPSLWKVCETPSALQVRLWADRAGGAARLTATPVAARDVTQVQLDQKILAALGRQQEISTRELAKRVQADRTTVTGRCEALLADGLLDSRAGPRNATLWHITPAGRDAMPGEQVGVA